MGNTQPDLISLDLLYKFAHSLGYDDLEFYQKPDSSDNQKQKWNSKL